MEFWLSGDPLPVSVHGSVCMAERAVDESGINSAPHQARRVVNLGRSRSDGANGLTLRPDLFPAYVKERGAGGSSYGSVGFLVVFVVKKAGFAFAGVLGIYFKPLLFGKFVVKRNARFDNEQSGSGFSA